MNSQKELIEDTSDSQTDVTSLEIRLEVEHLDEGTIVGGNANVAEAWTDTTASKSA